MAANGGGRRSPALVERRSPVWSRLQFSKCGSAAVSDFPDRYL